MKRDKDRSGKQLQKALYLVERKGQKLDELIETLPLDEPVKENLETTAWIRDRRQQLDPPDGFVEHTRASISARVSKLGKPRPSRLFGWLRAPLRTRAAMAAAFVLLAAIVFLNGAVAVNASAVSIPGDFIYPVKRVVESARLAFSFSPATDAALHVEFSHRRLMEIQYLALEGRTEYLPEVSRNFKHHLTESLVLVEHAHSLHDPTSTDLAHSLQDLDVEAEKAFLAVTGFLPGSARDELWVALQTSDSVSRIAAAILGE